MAPRGSSSAQPPSKLQQQQQPQRQHDAAFSSLRIDQQARRCVACLQAAATETAARRARRPLPFHSLLPLGQLADAATSSKQLLEIMASAVATDIEAVVHVVWVPPASRAAMLQLHAFLLRALAERDTAAKAKLVETGEWRVYGNLLEHLGLLICHLLRINTLKTAEGATLQLAARRAASLAVRMDVLPAISALMTAVREDEQQLANSFWVPMVALPPLIANIAWLMPSDEDDLWLGQRMSGAAMLKAVERSHVMEHCARSLVLATTMRANANSGAQGLGRRNLPGDDGTSWLAAQEPAGSEQGGGYGAAFASRTLSYIFECLKVMLGSAPSDGDSCCYPTMQPVRHRTAGTAGSGTAGSSTAGGGGGGGAGDRMMASARALLSGPCVQYAMAAHAVAQLAAADGGTRYGLTEAQALPPQTRTADAVWVLCGGAAAAITRERPSEQELDASMLSVLELWIWCAQQSPPVQLLPYDSHAVRKLCLRVLRVAVRSAEDHLAARRRAVAQVAGPTGRREQHPQPKQQQQQTQNAQQTQQTQQQQQQTQQTQQQQQRYLAVPLAERDCVPAVLLALTCAPEPFEPLSDDPGAAAAAEWWAAAVPALHMAVTLGDGSFSGRGPLPPLALQAIRVRVDCWPATDLPASPPPNLAAALAVGYLPLLERAMRVTQHCVDTPATAKYLLEPLESWPRLGRLLAYGEPRQAAALVATSGKLLRRWFTVEAATGRSGGPGSADSAVDMSHVVRQLPLTDLMSALCTLALARRMGCIWNAAAGIPRSQMVQPGMAAAALQEAMRTGVNEGVVRIHRDQAASLGIDVQCSCNVCGGRDCFGRCSATAAEASSGRGAAAVLQWAPGPSRQLLQLSVSVIYQWLPAVAALACAGPPADAAQGAPVPLAHMMAADFVMVWVPGLAAAHALAEGRLPRLDRALLDSLGGRRDAAWRRGAAASWRHLLLHRLYVVTLLAVMLRWHLQPWPQASLDDGSCRNRREGVMQEIVYALQCVVAEFPGAVAAALRDGRLPRRLVAALAAEGGYTSANDAPQRQWLVSRLHGLAAAAVAPPDMPAQRWYEPPAGSRAWNRLAASYEMGATLLSATPVDAQGDEPPLRCCSHPGCSNLAGDNEADLRLLECSGCGRARYCGAECQRAHWRAGHKGECARRGGAAGTGGTGGGGGGGGGG